MIKPKFKETISYFLVGNKIHIGEELGLSSEIDDYDGKIKSLLKLLNGENAMDDIIKEMISIYPTLNENEVAEGYFNARESVDYQRNNAAISPNVAILAGALVNELLMLVTGIDEVKSKGKLMEINFLKYESKVVSEWETREDCSICGNDRNMKYE